MATCSRKERICTWQFSKIIRIAFGYKARLSQSQTQTAGTEETRIAWLVKTQTDRLVADQSKSTQTRKLLETDALSRILPRNLLYGHFVAIMALLAKFAKMNTCVTCM